MTSSYTAASPGSDGSPPPGPGRPLTGLILAGGKSSRFGSDKASATLHGRPLLQWVASALEPVCSALVVVRAAGQRLPDIDVRIPVTIADDQYEARGPLAGLVSGFPHVATEYCFAVSCDAPLLRPELVAHLAAMAPGFDIVCPYLEEGFAEPLTAVYRASACLPAFRRSVENDVLKIVAAYDALRVRKVTASEVREADPDLRSFVNANRPEALAQIEHLLGR